LNWRLQNSNRYAILKFDKFLNQQALTHNSKNILRSKNCLRGLYMLPLKPIVLRNPSWLFLVQFSLGIGSRTCHRTKQIQSRHNCILTTGSLSATSTASWITKLELVLWVVGLIRCLMMLAQSDPSVPSGGLEASNSQPGIGPL